jgi:hypothetical protein
MGGAAVLGLSVLLIAPAAHAEETGPAPAATATIYVPSGFDADLSDTRSTGHYAVTDDGGLHLWTESNTGQDKVAEYVDTNVPLADVGEPVLQYDATFGIDPGFQLVVDFDGVGGPDGILVGEPDTYGNDWWLPGGSAKPFVKAGAPSTTGGSGSGWHGALDDWRAAFPDAVVTAFGFSLGSGVHGDGVLTAIDFNGTRYTFAADVVLGSKDECKNGGWALSTAPVYKNQGDCVSSFARTTNNGHAAPAPTTAATTSTTPVTTAAAAPRGNGGSVKKI